MTEGPTFARIPARAAGLKLTAGEWAVLHVICLHADSAGHAFPSLARIAQMTGMSRRHVVRSITRLRALGLLRSKRIAQGAGWANSHYEVMFVGVFPGASLPPGVVFPAVSLPNADVFPEASLPEAEGCSPGCLQGVPLDVPLTDHRTDLTRKSEVVEVEVEERPVALITNNECRIAPPADGEALGVEPVADGGGLPSGKPDRPNDDGGAPALDPAAKCTRYVTGLAGHRICGKPALLEGQLCPEHARPPLPLHPVSGKPNGRAAL
jgi:Helix-turn-helix domain